MVSISKSDRSFVMHCVVQTPTFPTHFEGTQIIQLTESTTPKIHFESYFLYQSMQDVHISDIEKKIRLEFIASYPIVRHVVD